MNAFECWHNESKYDGVLSNINTVATPKTTIQNKHQNTKSKFEDIRTISYVCLYYHIAFQKDHNKLVI